MTTVMHACTLLLLLLLCTATLLESHLSITVQEYAVDMIGENLPVSMDSMQ